MKKVANILLTAVLMAGLLSCAKTDRIYDDTKTEIAMKPVMHTPTKEIVEGTTYPTGVNFGVLAYYSSAYGDQDKWTDLTGENAPVPYIDDQKFVSKGDGTFGGSDPCYWPHQGSLVFAGYSPYDSGTPSFNCSTKTLTITGFTSYGQTDLMYFLPELLDGSLKGLNTSTTPVPASFNHALSLISFEIKADPLDDGKVTLKTVTLKNANTEGDFSATCVSSSSAGTFSWKNQINTSEYAVATSSLPKVLSSSSALATQDLFVPGSNLTNSPVVEFEYEIAYNTVDGSGDVVNATKEETTSFTIEDYTAEWEAGKKYVYAVTIGLNRIEFENLTAEWR